MTEPAPTPSPTPADAPAPPVDQKDLISHGPSLPIAIAAIACGAVMLILFARTHVDARHTPSLVGVNLAFVSLLLAALALYRARGVRGQGLTRILAGLGLLLGLAGPLIYTAQAVKWRKAVEVCEVENITAIARAAKEYARIHAGQYPPSLATLLAQGLLPPERLASPFTRTTPLTEADVRRLDTTPGLLAAHSDYTYVAGDLRPTDREGADHPVPGDILVAYANEPILRTWLPAAFSDGTARFLKLEDLEPALKASNASRRSLGLPTLDPPAPATRAAR